MRYARMHRRFDIALRAGLVATLAGTVAVVAPIDTSLQAASKTGRVAFRGYTVANETKGGCYGPVGIYASIDARVPKHLSPKDVKQAARASRPTNARVRISGKSYRLVIDRTVSGMAYHRVWWTFTRVGISKATARKLKGRWARIVFSSGGRMQRTKRAKIRDGKCG